jgi:hypothetical protein
MSMMLDIAGGIVIGGLLLGAFKTRIECVRSRGRRADEKVRAIGCLLLAVTTAAASWLIFIRTGVVPL